MITKNNTSMANFKVTVYLVNHNYGRYVERSIESVLCQTYIDYELIIIDDGSTDNSREILKKYQNIGNIKVIFQENKGLNATNNIAIRAAKGEYIMRLDADDYLDENALLVLVKELDNRVNCGLVFSDYYYIDELDNVIGQERRLNFGDNVSLKDMPAHGACTMFRLACLKDMGGYSEEFRCQDGFEIWLKTIERYDVHNVSLPLFYYRRHGKNLTGNNRRILETRASIKKKHVSSIQCQDLKVLTVIPIRGGEDDEQFAFAKLEGKTILDRTIDAASEAENTCDIIVTTSSNRILEYINNKNILDINCLARDGSDEFQNITLTHTLTTVLQYTKKTYDAILVLTLETPFRSSMYIDKAINTMKIFNVDSVVGVKPENEVYFQHDGSGMQVVGGGSQFTGLRLERDLMYKYVRGMQLATIDLFRSEGKCIGGTIGHVIFDDSDAHTVTSFKGIRVIELLRAEIGRR